MISPTPLGSTTVMSSGLMTVPSSVTRFIDSGAVLVFMTSLSRSYVPALMVAACRISVTPLRSTRLTLPEAGSAVLAVQNDSQVSLSCRWRLAERKWTVTSVQSSVGPSVTSSFRLPVPPDEPPMMLHEVTAPNPTTAAIARAKPRNLRIERLMRSSF